MNKKINEFGWFILFVLLVFIVISLFVYIELEYEKKEAIKLNELCVNNELCVCEEVCPFPTSRTENEDCIIDKGGYYEIKDCAKYKIKTNIEKLRTLSCRGIEQEFNDLKRKDLFVRESKYRYDLEVLSRVLNCT